ncbi:MAG: peptidoglycan-binding protein [Litorimonas sp.]
MAAASTSLKSKPKAIKPTVKKQAVKKQGAKKGAAKKGVVKKGVVKKAPSPKGPVSKSSASKNIAVKNTVKTAPKKQTLQQQLIQVETRLKRVNATTRKNVKALELLVNTLQSQSKASQTKQKAAFTRQITALNKKLSGMMGQSQAEITKDLSQAVSSSDMNEIQAALSRADERLTLANVAQSEALSKVNRHLANLATALEARFTADKADRTAAITAVETKLEKTVDDKTTQLAENIKTIEDDTAAALEVLGEKIENFAGELDQRQSRIDTHMGEKISEIALDTQAEFEAFRNDVDQRIVDISSRTPANNSSNDDHEQLGEHIQTLQSRLSNLEQHLADMQNAASGGNPLYDSRLPITNLAPPLPTSTNITTAQTVPTEPSVANPTNVVPINDAFTPAVTDLNPYSKAVTPAEEPAPVIDSHIPPEFDPAAYQVAAQQNLAAMVQPNHIAHTQPNIDVKPDTSNQPYAPISAQAVATEHLPAVPDLPPMATQGQNQQTSAPQVSSHQSLRDALPTHNIDVKDDSYVDDGYVEPSLPYSDPAYADNELRAERIGTPTNTNGKRHKTALPKTPLSGRNLRFLLVGSAIALLTLFAGKIILGGQYSAIPNKVAQSEAQSSSEDADDTVFGQANEASHKLGGPTENPIGQYAENAVPNITNNQAATLETAAAAGNPIAQHQLGTAYLKSNNVDEAVKLIRASAAQNLPAAQYRLAKLYEIGKGVTRDEVQARQLTERAAKSGHRVAMHDLALYYTDGRGGVDINVTTARGWFEQAAQHGVVDSQFNLAVLAESGNPVDRDLETAYFWYNIAANQGDQIAQQRASLITKGLSVEQISAADARIAAFTPRPVNSEVNGIFRNVPWTPAIKSVEIERVRQVQSYLAELGYEVGTADGAIGPNTRAAITAFEKANDLPETGDVNDALLDRLELVVGA